LKRVLVVDDETGPRLLLETILRDRGYDVASARDGVGALLEMESARPDLVVSDLRMPVMDGLELLGHVRQRWPGIPFVLVSVVEEIPTVVRAIQTGAADYVLKPASASTMLHVVERALEALPAGGGVEDGMPEIVGLGRAAVMTRQFVSLAARCDANVLICGATGTGKELVARAIHRLAGAGAGPFVAVNCAAVPGELFESQFFGHRRGAFTGATQDMSGFLSRAAGGVLFLDEMESLPPVHQAKLLRALDDGCFTPVGSAVPQHARFRVLAATNRMPDALLRSGELREDFYYRVRGLEIRLPRLAERREDLGCLTAHFLGPEASRLSPEARATLAEHDWPGNIRELRETLRRAAVMAAGGPIGPRHLGMKPRPLADGDAGPSSLRELELGQIERTLEACGGNRSQAARILGIDRSTLRRKLRTLRG